MPAAVTSAGSPSGSPASSRTTASTSRRRRGRCTRCSARTAPARSTLSNILTGLYRPDEGEILLDGAAVEFNSPREALDAGICMVHQHFRLVAPFTVAENVILGDHRGEGKKFIGVPAAHRAARRRARRALPHRRRSGCADLATLARRAAARRDPEGALPRGADPDPRRADRSAHAAGGGVALRDAARDGVGGTDGRLHLPQAPRGRRGLGPRHRPARRQERRHRRDEGVDVSLARVADGRPRRRRRRTGPEGALGRRRRPRARRTCPPSATAVARRCATSRSRCARARSSASPAWPATASASWPRW